MHSFVRLIGSLFCSNLAVQSFSVFVLYTIFRFQWSERANGFGLALFGALSVVSAAVVGPAFFTLLFSEASSPGTYLPAGAPWFCGAALLGAAIVLARKALEAEPAVEPDSRV